MTPYVLAVITDGRKSLIAQTIPSFLGVASYPPEQSYIFDDSGDPVYQRWLKKTFNFEVISRDHRVGFAGAMGAAWEFLSQLPRGPEFVFHLEDDFLFNRQVDIQAMIDVLQERPYLQQMALRRQPWNAREKAAGGVVETRRRAFTETTNGTDTWLEHRLFWTCNPSLYRRSLTFQGWPQVKRSERVLTGRLLGKRVNRFAYWGGLDSGEAVFHIGVKRNGNGY